MLEIHRQQIERYGGSPGLRDAAGLESAIAMAAAYLFHLCQNHAFVDGNKRVGANAAVTFLLMNDWEPAFGETELVDLVLAVASGAVAKPELRQIFDVRCRPT